MSKNPISDAQRRFIEDVATLLVPSGMPKTVARIYGYLLLSAVPLSLDRICADLELSKSSASVAARLLERHALLRRHAERGSKRALYSASENYAGLLAEKSLFLGKLSVLLDDSAGVVASGAATGRLKTMSRFCLSMRDAMEAAMREFDTSARSAPG